MDWTQNLIEDTEALRSLLFETRRVAVLGIKPESRASAPAHYVAAYLDRVGVDVIPVPVYYPEVTTILNKPVLRDLADLPTPIDLVNVFRRAEDIDQHVPALLALRPRAVWFQLGIRNDAAAKILAEAGIKVIQDRCLMVEHRRLTRNAPDA